MQIGWGGFVDWTTSNAKRCSRTPNQGAILLRDLASAAGYARCPALSCLTPSYLVLRGWVSFCSVLIRTSPARSIRTNLSLALALSQCGTNQWQFRMLAGDSHHCVPRHACELFSLAVSPNCQTAARDRQQRMGQKTVRGTDNSGQGQTAADRDRRQREGQTTEDEADGSGREQTTEDGTDGSGRDIWQRMGQTAAGGNRQQRMGQTAAGGTEDRG